MSPVQKPTNKPLRNREIASLVRLAEAGLRTKTFEDGRPTGPTLAIHEMAERLEAAEDALAWIRDWPHVKLYKGNETAHLPMIVHERAKAALR